MPAKVKEFKSKIRKLDALLIATPEYNYSVPGRRTGNPIDLLE
jgi:chromate reductase, NAD(P)H dehydrogenase (quinone)